MDTGFPPTTGAALPADPAQWCREVCLGLPDTSVDSPFGPGAEVFRIQRKMFALLSRNPRVSEHPIVNLKADPDELPLLIANYDWILPGFHMNKRHWITVELRAGGDLELVEGLVEDSYDNVVLGLPGRLKSPLRGAVPQPMERPGLGNPSGRG
ncbi:Predicted DNA-binding protein, MmcQ/YjbR family [Sanguibacter gelidistatuariae]|uniref:Predicted DNA-binding protein, MmcQ/YjbR family n=1 Tax=Sanguibacter gelidistatuariae TaxID=1814289 RepID=A0A1G6MQP6_9MICO|nr:MmcQ/YjbR family DNA-binding protein [Sanguibacter gelidistatuariae]SDC57859.1 Predicted DNA-binding protein, MmcQ/YjbR family [Sanguibacter gelidistatuariae]